MNEKEEGSVTKMLKELKSFFVILFLLILTFGSGFLLSDCSAKAKYTELLDRKNHSVEELEVASNKVRSLSSVISEKSEEAERLKEIIRDYETRPAEIRYIVQTETVLVGNQETTTEIPPDHLFRFNNGLPVSRFATTEEGYSFSTFDVTFETTTVVSEDETAISLSAISSYEPDIRYPIPVSSQVVRVREHKIFEPHLLVGATGSLDLGPVAADLTASLYTSLFHITENIDIVSPRISFNNDSLRIGLDVISYNIGGPLPIATDLWVGIGVSGKIGNQAPSIDLTIGSKF
jgi:hypothetical protein